MCLMTSGKIKLCTLLAAAALLAGCSPRTAEHVRERTVHDTVRVAAERADTFKTGDTLRVYVRERGDTVTVWRDRVRWRTQVREAHDTVWASRRDTLWRTRKETVTVERPREAGDWAWPMATGALAGAAAALYLFNRKN